MNSLEQFKEAKKWYDKIIIIALFHHSNVQSNSQWLIKDTAKYFGLSVSTVAEDLAIAEKYNELKNIGSRNKAIKKLRGIKI